MITRRGLFGRLAAGGAVAFCGCQMLDQAAAQGASRSLPVMLGGQRVRTVDTHAHCLIPAALALMSEAEQHGILDFPARGMDQTVIVLDQRLHSMDAMGVDMQILSINPFWYGTDRDKSAKIVDMQNKALAELCTTRPDRFAAFASISLQHPDLAVTELEHAVNVLGLKGAAIGGTVGPLEFADPRFDPVWARAEELGAVLYIHPNFMPELNERLKGNGWLQNTVGVPLGTTIALQHLIFQGTLDRFPNLKILGAHGGGYLPSYAARSDHACFVSPANCDPSIKLRKQPSEYLRQIYFDNLLFEPEGLRHLIAQVGVSQVMLGSDFPYPWVQSPVDIVFDTPSLSDEDRLAILNGNATRLFRLHA